MSEYDKRSAMGTIMRRAIRSLLPAAAVMSCIVHGANPAGAAPTAAACVGQFFSEHAGSATAGVTVGGFVSGTAQEQGREFGREISSTRTFPRDDCGL